MKTTAQTNREQHRLLIYMYWREIAKYYQLSNTSSIRNENRENMAKGHEIIFVLKLWRLCHVTFKTSLKIEYPVTESGIKWSHNTTVKSGNRWRRGVPGYLVSSLTYHEKTSFQSVSLHIDFGSYICLFFLPCYCVKLLLTFIQTNT